MERHPYSPSLQRSPRDLRGQRVTVMGLGAFGGGEGVVRFFSDRGARVTITDLKFEPDLAETLGRLNGCKIEALHLGGHLEEDFRETDLVVVNPAVPRSNPYLDIARQAGVELTSEMNLFIEHNRGSIAAVTGSIGKSTTTALLERMLAASGMKTWLGGNMGRSLLPEVDAIQPEDFVVLELSSFQLADLDRIQFRPEVAVVTNFRPNHLDWHRDLDDYRWAKQTILRYQTTTDTAVLNANDPDVASWEVRGRRLWFGEEQGNAPLDDSDSNELERQVRAIGIPVERKVDSTTNDGAWLDDHQLNVHIGGRQFELSLTNIALRGRHHLNVAAATAAAVACGAGSMALFSVIGDFTGLPHRQQEIAMCAGVRVIDDSKATTPESAIAAIEAMGMPIVLIAGGSDKRVGLAPFAKAIARHVRSVALVGQTASTLEALITEARTANRTQLPEIFVAPTFDEACRWAFDHAYVGDCVLLSPGCASYGMFKNYVERAEAFRTATKRWMESGPQPRFLKGILPPYTGNV